MESTRSIKEFFEKTKSEYGDIESAENNHFLFEAGNYYSNNKISNERTILVELEIIYNEWKSNEPKNLKENLDFTQEDQIFEESKNFMPLDTYRNTAKISLPYSKILGTFIEEELKKSNEEKNYITIELRAKRNKISLESILNCLEFFINKNFEFHYNKENLISYFYAFSLCHLHEKRKEVMERLLHDLVDDNIIYFLKVVSTLDDNFLHSYSFWLLRYLINKNEKLSDISYSGYNFLNIVRISKGSHFSFDENRIIYINRKQNALSANVNFLKKYFDSVYKQEVEKYFKVNDYFNMGKVMRRKSDDSLVDDYPHYYQLVLENDPSMVLYAIRPSENSNFIISRNIDDFSKYGPNYVAEVVPNFWGTYFDVYDYGYEKGVYERSPRIISKLREKIGSITYETNIMGECPRYFKLEINHNKEVHRLENLKPEFNEQMDCFCLNFYGRVKKASAKNFQIIYPDDTDNILLQHGKVNRDEFNIDFREPFNFIFAFAVSLIAIGKKRVVS